VPPRSRRPGPATAGHVRTPCGALPARNSRFGGAATHHVPASGVSGQAGGEPGCFPGYLRPSPRPLAAEPTSYPFLDIPHTCGTARHGVQSGRPQNSLTRMPLGSVPGGPIPRLLIERAVPPLDRESSSSRVGTLGALERRRTNCPFDREEGGRTALSIVRKGASPRCRAGCRSASRSASRRAGRSGPPCRWRG